MAIYFHLNLYYLPLIFLLPALVYGSSGKPDTKRKNISSLLFLISGVITLAVGSTGGIIIDSFRHLGGSINQHLLSTHAWTAFIASFLSIILIILSIKTLVDKKNAANIKKQYFRTLTAGYFLLAAFLITTYIAFSI